MQKTMEGLNEIYQLMAQTTSVEDTLKLYHQLKGLTITFPTKLISREYIISIIKKDLEEKSKLSNRDIQKYARNFDYSERQIKRFVIMAKQQINDEQQVKEKMIPYVANWLHSQTKEKEAEKNERN